MNGKKTIFDLPPGSIVTRQQINDDYGGGIQGGILTPAGGRLIFLFSDPSVIKNHGYNYDGWVTEDQKIFDYTGRGASGDQKFTAGNKAIANSETTGAEIHLFLTKGTVGKTQQKLHRYVGRFRTNPTGGWRLERSVGSDGKMRSVIVFTLERYDTSVMPDPDADKHRVPRPADVPVALEVPAEQTKAIIVHRHETSAIAVERKERQIEDRLREALQVEFRLAIRPPGSRNTLYTDVWDPDERVLFEVKSSASRQDIRMAVGQLLDYRRFIDGPEVQCAVVVPHIPERDLVDFIHSLDMELWTWDDTGKVYRA